jgi:AraC-like DNA-binding protein
MQSAPPGKASVKAWRPAVSGVAEVLHAYFPDHAYPSHTHDTWTLMVIDSGAVSFDLERHDHVTNRDLVTLLPPHVPHDGHGVTVGGFRKRVLYLPSETFAPSLVGSSVDRPTWTDPALRRELHLLHGALASPGDAFEAENRLALVVDRVSGNLASIREPTTVRDPGLADRLRLLLDAHVVTGLTLGDAAAELGAHPTHLVRAFRREYGIAPHRYLTGRRLDLARHALLAGHRPADVAADVGFHDQAHLTRHFKRLLGVAPGAYAASA